MSEVVMAVSRLPNHPVRRRMAIAATADARRTRLAAITEPAEWQEEHSPTIAIKVRLTSKKTVTIARRRTGDAKLWDAMSGFQQQAAQAIADGFELITVGTEAKGQRFDRTGVTGYRAPSTAQIEASEDYWKWAKRAQREGLSHAAVVDILVLGESCRSVDSSRQKRKGWAMGNLLAALNIYCDQQGWPTKDS